MCVCVCGIIYFNFVHSIIWLHKQGLGQPYFLFFDPKISVWVEFFALYKCWFLRAFAYYNGTENPKRYFYYVFRKYVIIMLCSPFQVKSIQVQQSTNCMSQKTLPRIF
jgi:hypothetical protein